MSKLDLIRIPEEILRKHKIQGKARIFKMPRNNKFSSRAIRLRGDIFQPYKAEMLKKLGTFYGFADAGSIYLVNGCQIRRSVDIDFTCGGHGFRYHYIPFNEIWIDNGLVEEERAPTICHELIERALMKERVDYNTSHDQASRVEMMMRSRIYDKEVKKILEDLEIGFELTNSKTH